MPNLENQISRFEMTRTARSPFFRRRCRPADAEVAAHARRCRAHRQPDARRGDLGLAQSAVSRQVAELERALGGALFTAPVAACSRPSSPPGPATRAEPPGATFDELAHTSRELPGTPTGLVTLGLVPGVASFLAAALHGAVAKQWPQIRLRILEGYSGDMEAALSQGNIDLAVLNRYRARAATATGGSSTHRFASSDAVRCCRGRSAQDSRAAAVGPQRP